MSVIDTEGKWKI